MSGGMNNILIVAFVKFFLCVKFFVYIIDYFGDSRVFRGSYIFFSICLLYVFFFLGCGFYIFLEFRVIFEILI